MALFGRFELPRRHQDLADLRRRQNPLERSGGIDHRDREGAGKRRRQRFGKRSARCDRRGADRDLVDGRFSEKEAQPIANQNSKMLRVRLGEPFMARQGAMVAYQGNVEFSFEGGGASRFIKKALTGEGLPLMRCQGQGDVFLAERAFDVHLLQLKGAGLSISGKNVLAFSSSLEWNIERVRGGSIATGGLFNTTLRGTGWVALTTDGPPVVLNAAEAPTFADTNAVVAWSSNLQTQLKTSFTAGALIGRGSGEAIQVSFYGNGFVIVQPSEGISVPLQ